MEGQIIEHMNETSVSLAKYVEKMVVKVLYIPVYKSISGIGRPPNFL